MYIYISQFMGDAFFTSQDASPAAVQLGLHTKWLEVVVSSGLWPRVRHATPIFWRSASAVQEIYEENENAWGFEKLVTGCVHGLMTG